ncbi:MAG: LysM peptidoglycan-binding domain-containing protein [Lachnospiraceae bacterium]|nr:LysM peptidoglycan-binding domain-containing protein [Lachnospiraceae bacterium]
MSILIGHASLSEDRKINGIKGDQTGSEVCTRTWYSKPWDFMAVHPDAAVREKHAKAVEVACANDNIGYGQSDRNTLNTLAKAVNYDLSKVGKCNCDCSSLQNVAAVASGAPGVSYGNNGWTTSSMKAALQAAGYKIITDSTYLTSADYCVRGAIYVKAGSHTVCGLTNGSKSGQTLAKAGLFSGANSGSSVTPGGYLTFNVGDVVQFGGSRHYTSANATNGSVAKVGPAKITAISNGGKHPYHVIHTDSKSNVYGWVDAADIGAVASGSTSGTKTHKVVSGDTLSAIAGKNRTTVAKIVAANKSTYPKIAVNYIVVGWTLTIPQ